MAGSKKGVPHPGTGKIADLMRAAGYISASAAARATGYSLPTVHRWMDDGKVVGKLVAGTRRYVLVASLVAFLDLTPAMRAAMGLAGKAP